MVNFRALFTRNDIVRQSAAALAMQVFKTSVSGSTNYLRSVLGLDDDTARRLDVFTTRAVRHIVGLPSNASTALVWAQSRLITACGIHARERQRLFLQLQLTPYQGAIAVHLLRRLLAEPLSAVSTAGTWANWAHVTSRLRDGWAHRGAIFDEPRSYGDITRCAHVLARSLSFIDVRDDVLHDAGDDVPPSTIRLPVASRGSRRNLLALTFGLSTPVAALGVDHGHTPVSARGPDCSGALAIIADDRQYRAVALLVLGDEALHLPPFAPPTARADVPVDYAARFARQRCRVCGTADESLYHVICSCTHERVTRWRANAVASLRVLLSTLWHDALAVLQRTRRAPPLVADDDAAALAAFVAGAALTPHERSFLLYWTLSAVPWPHAATVLPADAPQFPAAAALGALFDALNVRPGLLRPWASKWLAWSDYQVRLLAAAVSGA